MKTITSCLINLPFQNFKMTLYEEIKERTTVSIVLFYSVLLSIFMKCVLNFTEHVYTTGSSQKNISKSKRIGLL